jgi:hypothetical protein
MARFGGSVVLGCLATEPTPDHSPTVEVLARTDLAASWLQAQIRDHQGSQQAAASTCSHDPSLTGGRLEAFCDPVVERVCRDDAYCCSTRWDETCVGELASHRGY